MKARYEDTCATPLSREDLQQMTNESAGKLQQNLRTSSKKLVEAAEGTPMMALDPPQIGVQSLIFGGPRVLRGE